MTSVNVQLTDEIKAFLEQQGARQGIRDLNEVIFNHLVRWQQREAARKNIETIIIEGLESPTVAMTDERPCGSSVPCGNCAIPS